MRFRGTLLISLLLMFLFPQLKAQESEFEIGNKLEITSDNQTEEAFDFSESELSESTSTSSLAKSISIFSENGNLITIIKKLSKENNISIVYDADLLNINGISINIKNKTLYQALEEILSPHDISFYEYEYGKIALAKTKRIGENTGGVYGFVTDTTGERLIGANVVIRELMIGSQTDSKGYYSIKNIKPGTYIFEASFMGYHKYVKKIHITAGHLNEINVSLISTAFQIGGIEVIGSTELLPKDVNSKTIITSGEIEHFQASSIKDVLDLVPGVQKSDNPGLGKTSQISVRGNETDDLSSFGTLIIVDGSPVSNNANMQFGRSTSATTGVNNTGAGVDLRTIPADNIESIEVITGLPSVRYGDFTEGIINVQTKLGPIPNRLKIKNNPNMTEGNFGGGFLIGESGLNYNFNLARDQRDIRKEGDEYYRITAQSILSNNFWENSLNNNLKFSVQTVLDDESPTGDMYQTKNYNHGFTLGLSTWGKYKPIEDVSFFDYNLFVNMNRQNSMKSHLVQSPMRVLPNGDTVSSYMGKIDTRGIEWSMGARLEWNRLFYTGDIIHKIIIGTEPQFNANTGEGLIVDSLFNYYGFDSEKRSYDYKTVPGQLLMNIYAEDKFTGHLLFDYSVLLGFRYEMYRPYKFNLSGLWGKGNLVESHQGTFFNPRFNLMVYLSKDSQLRLSAGTTSKSPSMSVVYSPEEVFGWRNPVTTLTEYYHFNQRALDLKGYRETQYEVSYDQKLFNTIGLTASAYYRERNSESEDQVVPAFSLSTSNGSSYLYYVGKYSKSINAGSTFSRGLEFSFRTNKIKPLNIELQLVASYSFQNSFKNTISYDATPDKSKGQYPNFQVPGYPDSLYGYSYSLGGYMRDNLLINYYLKYTHPTLGLWVTLRIEQLKVDRYQDQNREPEELALLNETEKISYYFDREIKARPNKFLFNLNISKALFSGAEVSFYVNNFLDDAAVYRYLYAPPSTYQEVARNPSLFYGLEFSMTVDNLLGRNLK